MSVELWKTIFDWATVVLIALTVVSGAGALITGKIINTRQEARLRQFDRDLTGAKIELGKQEERTAGADARVAGLERDASDAKTEMAKQQERAAVAEHNLLELQQKVRWRTITPAQRNKFLATVVPFRKGLVQITTASGDPEAINFSNELRALLTEGGYSAPPVDIVPLLYPQFAIGLSLVIQSQAPLDTSPSDPQQCDPKHLANCAWATSGNCLRCCRIFHSQRKNLAAAHQRRGFAIGRTQTLNGNWSTTWNR